MCRQEVDFCYILTCSLSNEDCKNEHHWLTVVEKHTGNKRTFLTRITLTFQGIDSSASFLAGIFLENTTYPDDNRLIACAMVVQFLIRQKE